MSARTCSWLKFDGEQLLWSAVTCHRFVLGRLGARRFDSFNLTVVATGRDRPKRRQVGALQRVAPLRVHSTHQTHGFGMKVWKDLTHVAMAENVSKHF